MNKIPLSVSSTLTALDTTQNKLAVNAYANETGKTGTAAPVLIAVESARTVGAEEFAAALPAKGGQGTEEQARLVVNAIASVCRDLVDEYGAFTANTPFGTIETFVSGSLENATDAIDPTESQAFLGIVLPPEMTKQFAKIETYVPTAACPASLKRICDKATGLHEIRGNNPFYMQGYGLSYGSAGETAKLLNPLTRATVCDIAIDATTKSLAQLTGTLPNTTAIAAGTYIVQLTTLAGAGEAGGTLWPLELEVKLTEAIVPPVAPTLTKVYAESNPSAESHIQCFEEINDLIGTALTNATAIKYTWMSGGEEPVPMEETGTIVSKTDTLLKFKMPEVQFGTSGNLVVTWSGGEVTLSGVTADMPE